jgi:hypothetical protein
MNKEQKHKNVLQYIIIWFLLYTGGFMTFSTVVYFLECDEKWFSRLFLAVVSFGFGSILMRD